MARYKIHIIYIGIIFILVCLMLLPLLLSFEVRGKMHGQAVMLVHTSNRLMRILSIVDSIESVYTDDVAPSTPKAFMAWYAKHGVVTVDVEMSGEDYTNGRLLDSWNNEVRLIAMDGKLAAMASCGSNGQWDNGQGDDIVVWREGGETSVAQSH